MTGGHTEPFAIEVRLPAGDLQAEWQRCNMLANYIAEYVAQEFSEREWAENLISTVANECLEAIARLSPAADDVAITCQQHGRDLVLALAHGVRDELAPAYTQLMTALGGDDVGDVYFELLAAADRPEPSFNQLGLAMIAHDFRAHVELMTGQPAGRAAVRLRVPMDEIIAHSAPAAGGG